MAAALDAVLDVELLDDSIALAEKFNANLEPELLASDDARAVAEKGARLRRLADFMVTSVAPKLHDDREIAKVAGTSVPKAREIVETGRVMKASPELDSAMRSGELSLDQAAVIAPAEQAAPGVAEELLRVAKDEGFHVLRDEAKRLKLEAEQHLDLPERQREARAARSRTDELGMVDIHLRFQPHVGTPIVNRAEAEARRLHRAATRVGNAEPFERHLADAYARMLSGSDVKPSTTRPELVVLVSYEVAKRGWKDLREGEHCKIPGVGPVSPRDAKEIAERAVINVALTDGVDLRGFKRFGRYVPPEIRVALELGEAPDFAGKRCVVCGNRFRPEDDHEQPVAAGGPTSLPNIRSKCYRCHKAKTEADRRNGRLQPPDP